MRLQRSKATELMDLASAGDNGAFAALAADQQERLFRLALACGLGAADAAEACQEALLRAYQNRHQWCTGGDAHAYLSAVTVNVTREFRRRQRREHLGLTPQIADFAMQETPRPGGLDVRKLAEALELLPPRQREAVACRFLRRMSVQETAIAMGCAEGTVKAAVFAALANLRVILKEMQ